MEEVKWRKEISGEEERKMAEIRQKNNKEKKRDLGEWVREVRRCWVGRMGNISKRRGRER